MSEEKKKNEDLLGDILDPRIYVVASGCLGSIITLPFATWFIGHMWLAVIPLTDNRMLDGVVQFMDILTATIVFALFTVGVYFAGQHNLHKPLLEELDKIE